MPARPSTETKKAGASADGPTLTAGVRDAVASTSGTSARPQQQQQQKEKIFFINHRASLEQCQQLFGATCRIKLQRCAIPNSPTAVANILAPLSTDVPADSTTVSKVEEASDTGSDSSEENGHVKVIATFPPRGYSKQNEAAGTKKKGGKRVVHRKSPARCLVCRKTLHSKEYLKVHMRKHSAGKKRYSCESCKRSFWCNSAFSYHKKARNQQNGVCPPERKNCGRLRPKGPWTCKICGKTMKDGHYYPIHMRIHRGEKRFKCGECGKGFVCTGDLTKHKRIHSDVWQFNCVFCERGFHHKSGLFGHLRVHTEETPYFCVVNGCGQSFRAVRALKSHRRLIHLKKY